jgi:hypothetical protein
MTVMATSISGPSASGAEKVPDLTTPLSRKFLRFVAPALLLAAATSTARPARAADPTIADCLAAAESSLKLRAEHKIRLTRTQLLVCASATCPAEIRQECSKRIDEVNAAAPTIVLTVKDKGGRELGSVKVSVDGQTVADHLDGSALAIDPGAHEFTFEASGQAPYTQTIILHEGEKDRREVVVLGGGPIPQSTTEAPASGAAGVTTVSDASPPGTGNGMRVAGLVIGGVGLAGVAVGAVFGIVASSSWSKADKACPSHAGCSASATSDRSSAVTDATVSTVGFIAGGVLAAAGVTLFLVAPRSTAPAVGLQVRPGGLAINGTF